MKYIICSSNSYKGLKKYLKKINKKDFKVSIFWMQDEDIIRRYIEPYNKKEIKEVILIGIEDFILKDFQDLRSKKTTYLHSKNNSPIFKKHLKKIKERDIN